MSTDEQARELMAKNRHHEEHINESMLNRASEEVGQSENHTQQIKLDGLLQDG